MVPRLYGYSVFLPIIGAINLTAEMQARLSSTVRRSRTCPRTYDAGHRSSLFRDCRDLRIHRSAPRVWYRRRVYSVLRLKSTFRLIPLLMGKLSCCAHFTTCKYSRAESPCVGVHQWGGPGTITQHFAYPNSSLFHYNMLARQQTALR